MEKKVTPMSLASKAGSVEVCHEYDWRKQSVKYDTCKAGTAFQTGSVRFGSGCSPEDWQAD